MAFWSAGHIPLWPLTSAPKKWTGGGSFGASRDGGSRRHQGIDLYAPFEAPVVALEDGVVTAVQGWSGSGTKGLWVDHPEAGFTALYGAVKPGSYPAVGTKVKRGEQIATIGKYPKGSTMLHIEAWALGTVKPRPTWKSGDPPASNIDITSYLEAAKGNVQKQDPKDSKTLQCGGDVTADDGALNLDVPCSIIGGVQVCNAANISAWQTSLEEELDALKGLVLAAEKAGKKSAIKGSNYIIGMGEEILDKWGLFTFEPSKAVAETAEATRRVRCEKLDILKALEGQQKPQDQQQGGQGGNQGQSQNGQQKPSQGSGGGGGAAPLILAAVGVGLLLRRKR